MTTELRSLFGCNFTPKLREYLNKLGFDEKKVGSFSYETKFFHDLGFMGDTAEECMVMLEDIGVDMSGFNFRTYFPPEFHDNFILNLLPIPERLLIKKEKYKPLTLAMLEKVLDAKKWSILS